MRRELLGAILCGLFVVWLVWRTPLRRKTGANDWMPRELRASRLAYAEQLFRSSGPVSVSARVDRAYRDQAGVVTLVELKTRKADRVYLLDVIELSAQRYALQSQTGERVSEHGYVVVQQVGSRRRKVHRVQLLADERLASMVVRRERLLMDTEEPDPPCATALCEHCAYLPECDWSAQQPASRRTERSARVQYLAGQLSIDSPTATDGPGRRLDRKPTRDRTTCARA